MKSSMLGAVVLVGLCGATAHAQTSPWQVVHSRADLPPAPVSEAVDDALADAFRPLCEVRTDIRPPAGDLPDNRAALHFAPEGLVIHDLGVSRPWVHSAYFWEAAATCHGPTYFEDVNLERYGYWHPAYQPILSAGHFFGTIPLLPYLMTVDPPHDCVYTLGHYRAGNYVPFEKQLVPLRKSALAVQAGVVSGMILVIP